MAACCWRSISLAGGASSLIACRFDPRAADEAFVELLHLEDQVGHVVADARSTSCRTAACPRACTRPWDRPGRSRGGRRWSAGGPSPAGALSRRCRGSAAAAPAPSAASRGGNGPRRPAKPCARPLRDRAWPARRSGSRASHVVLSQVVRSSSLPLWPVTAPSVAVGAALVGEQLLDALAGPRRRPGWPARCCGWLCSTSSVRISSRCLFLRSSSVELGVEPPLGPLDEVLAQEALPLAAGAAGGEAVQAGEHRVLRFALVVGGDGPLVRPAR